MNQIINATFEDGVFKPDEPPTFPSMTRVRLTIEPLTGPEEGPTSEPFSAGDELERLWDEVELDSDGPPPKRDQLHDRY